MIEIRPIQSGFGLEGRALAKRMGFGLQKLSVILAIRARSWKPGEIFVRYFWASIHRRVEGGVPPHEYDGLH
jgi:hypothetical protein